MAFDEAWAIYTTCSAIFDMVIKTVVHFEIPASDVEKLSKFYTEVFAWKFRKVPMPDFDYWLISTGPQGKSVGGGMYKKMGPNDGPRNFIQVNDIDSSIAEFKNAGGAEMMGKQQVPGEGWTFLGKDPEGNVVGLFQSLPKPPKKRASKKKRK